MACYFSIIGCKDTKPMAAKNYVSINKNLYDSIQIIVDTLVKQGAQYEYYILSFYCKREDSIDFTLRTIHPKALQDVYKTYYYFYNKDSSLLLVENNKLIEHESVENILQNLPIETTEHIEPAIFNSIDWKVTFAGNNIIVDRTFGMREIEKKAVRPTKWFVPPQ